MQSTVISNYGHPLSDMLEGDAQQIHYHTALENATAHNTTNIYVIHKIMK